MIFNDEKNKSVTNVLLWKVHPGTCLSLSLEIFPKAYYCRRLSTSTFALLISNTTPTLGIHIVFYFKDNL